MAFNIKNDETDAALRALTELTGESLTEAVTRSLKERLERERRIRSVGCEDRLAAAIAQFRLLPVLDERSDDQILGYDAVGLPT